MRAFLCLSCIGVAAAFSCLDEIGSFVDYWVAIKVNDGSGYFYQDANGGATFEKSRYDMGTNATRASGAVLNTIGQLYDGALGDAYAYALYNDDTPAETVSSSRAHSKGVVLFNASIGFWLVHSLPRWPAFPGYGGLPDSTYGQSFFCGSYRTAKLEAIAQIQLLQWPQLYASGLSPGLADSAEVEGFAAWIAGGKTTAATTRVTSLISYNGRHFVHYAKSALCECNLWEDVVAPGVNTSLLRTETWQNGAGGQLPSACAPKFGYDVTNVTHVGFEDGTHWKETQDHSKWAVSAGDARTACVGDNNRMASQAKRGGGALCYESAELWAAFDAIVETAYSC